MKPSFIPKFSKRINDDRTDRGYSLTTAIRAMHNHGQLSGIEREYDQEVTHRMGPSPHNGTFRIPTNMALLQRGMTSAGVSGSNYLVGSDLLPSSFIDMLRAKSLVIPLGCTMLPGLVGNITIPKGAASASAYWLSNEGAAITESQMTIGQLALTPKTVGCYSEVSRQLMLQSTPAVDQLIMSDFAKTVATAVDAAIINGSGSTGEPMGILNTNGIGTVTGTSLGFTGLLELQTDVANNDADLDSCAYVTTPAVAGLLAQRQRFTSTDSPLWEGKSVNGKVLGVTAIGSTTMPAGTMLFGDFSQVVVAEWGSLEIAISDSHASNFKSGVIGIRAFLSVDVGVQQAGAFSKATSIT